MIFYRVHYVGPTGSVRGYDWFTSKRSAQQAIRWWIRESHEDHEYNARFPKDYQRTADLAAITITPTKAGILDALNNYAYCDEVEAS